MTPTTLYSDRQLFVSFYKNAVSRLKGVALLYGIMMFITFPMFYFIGIGEAMERLAEGRKYYGFNGHLNMYPAAAIFYFAIVVAAVISLSAIANSFMHNKKAVDVFHALPVKRPSMLLANFAAVSTWMFALQAVCYLAVGITSAFTIPVPTIPLVAEFLKVCLFTTAVAAMASFCAVCANTVLDSVIFTAAFNSVVPAYTLLIYALLSTFIEGFATRRNVMIDSIRFSPVCMLYHSFFAEDMPITLFSVIIYIVFIAVVMAAACAIYVKRKSERAQSNNTSGIVYRFIMLAASVGGGAFFGFVISEMFGWTIVDRSNTTLVLISCLFTVSIYLVFSTITNRRVNPGKKGALWLAASVVLTAGLFISMSTGFFGMESYVPALEDIRSVKLYYAGDYNEVTYYTKDENGLYRYSYGSNTGVVFEDREEIAVIRGMHATVVENLDAYEDDVPKEYYRFEIDYTLENGRTVQREYYSGIPVQVIREFTTVEDMETFKRQVAPVLMSPASDLSYFEIKDGFGKNQQKLDLSDSEKELLYNAVAQDTLNRTSQMKKQHNEMSLAKISFRYKEITTDMSGVALSENSSPIVISEMSSAYYYKEEAYSRNEMYQNYCFEVTSDCINTIKALQQLGLEQYTVTTQPQNIKAVVSIGSAPYYETQTANFWIASKNFVDYGFAEHINWAEDKLITTDAAEIAQISEGCTSTVYSPSVKSKPVFAVVFADENADLSNAYNNEPECICYYLPYDEAPQFIKDYFDGRYEYYGFAIK